MNGGYFAVHHPIIDNHLRPESVPDALVPEADPEHGRRSAKGTNDFVREPRFARRTRAGRHQDPLGVQGADLVEGDLVVAMNAQLGFQLAQILDEVVGKRIVIVDHQHHGRRER